MLLIYLLDFHVVAGAVVLGDDLEVVKGSLALGLQPCDARTQLLKVHLRGSRHSADLRLSHYIIISYINR